jgi:hypothetical protein
MLLALTGSPVATPSGTYQGMSDSTSLSFLVGDSSSDSLSESSFLRPLLLTEADGFAFVPAESSSTATAFPGSLDSSSDDWMARISVR